MWPAEPLAFLVAGATRIEWGVRNDARSPVWRNCLRLDIPDVPRGKCSIEVLADALGELRGLLAAQRGAEPAGKRRRTALRVVISERWLAIDRIPWSRALFSAASAERNIREHLQFAGCRIAPDSMVRVDDRAYGEACLAVAYPEQLIAALADLIFEQGFRLASMLPLGVVACEDLLPGHPPAKGGMAVVEDGFATIFSLQDGRISALSPCAALDDPSSLDGLWRRLCFRDPALFGSNLVTIAPGTRAKESENPPDFPLLAFASRRASSQNPLDAVGSPPHVGRRQWLALSVSASLLLCASTFFAITSREAARLEHRLDASRLAAASAVAETSPEERLHIFAVNEAVRELNLPVDVLLKSLQPPKDIHVAPIEIDLASGHGAEEARQGEARTIKLVADAATGTDMTRYAEFLGDRPAIVRADLIRHEIVESEPARPYRITMEIQWRD